MKKPLYTIGHSHHEPEAFIALLKQHGVAVVADVRSQPYSQLHPHYNREVLKIWLRESGIDYVFLGRELGARREEPECYVGQQARYELIMKQPLFLEGIARLNKGLEDRTIAIMCAEKDPLDCHRTILIGRHLRDSGLELLHILEDGSIETTRDVELRLLEKTKTEADLFNWEESEETRVLEAYEKRAVEIAYRKMADAI